MSDIEAGGVENEAAVIAIQSGATAARRRSLWLTVRIERQHGGRRTLCGFHTYVGAVDMWVSCRGGVGRAASRLCTRD